MNYRDVYYARIQHMGDTVADRIRNNGMRSFERWKAESPFTVDNLSVERGVYFSGIIEENKDKEAKKLMFLHVSNDIPLAVGDIMSWLQSDGSIEKWLLLQKEKKVNETYQTFIILQCNYEIKWIDENGHVQRQWAYIVSSTDDKIKGNFRTWHNLITPQPNKYAEIIMPRRDVARGTNFIIEDEGWKMIEADITSVKGIIYMSLTESKINYIYDDLEIDLADTDRLATYRLELPDTQQVFSIGSEIKPTYTLMKNDEVCDEEVTWDSSNKAIARVINDRLIAVAEGTCTITATLKRFPQITAEMEISVGRSGTIFSAYIDGNDSIKLDRYCTYTLVGTDTLMSAVKFSIDSELATIISFDDNSCTIHANNKNKLGEFTLVAKYLEQEYSKTIVITPLW